MEYELMKQGLVVERQVAIPVYYDGLTMDIGFRADLIVDKEVIVEIKSVEAVKPVLKTSAHIPEADRLQNRFTD